MRIHSQLFFRGPDTSTVKLPFPLTLGFKSMLQRGIETPDMDVRWVSSLSWYFLNFFGLNGLYRLLLGNDNGEWPCPQFLIPLLTASPAADSSKDMSATPFSNFNAAPAGPQDYNKLFKAERDNLEFSNGIYTWVGDEVEDRILKRYNRLPSRKP